uniref:Uncharacterized protein n=1 Tax=Auxenochlorella protothecoides TaxID=3075 RepID=A0A1D1ZWM0_AUXPR
MDKCPGAQLYISIRMPPSAPHSTLPPLCKAAMAVCKAAGFYDIMQINALHTEVDVLRAYQEFVERHLSTVKALEVREPLECDCTSKYKDFRAWFPTLLTSVKAPCLEQVIGVVLPRVEQLDVASLSRSIRSLNFSLAGADPVTDVELLRSLLQLPNLSELRLLVSREVHQALLGPGTSLGSWKRLQKLELVVNRGHPSDTLEGLTRACPNLTHLHNHEAMSLPSDIGDLQSLRHVAVACSDSTRGVAGIEHLGPSQALTLQVGTVGDLPPAQSRCRWVRLDQTDRYLQHLIWRLAGLQSLRGCAITKPLIFTDPYRGPRLYIPWQHPQVLQITCRNHIQLCLPPNLLVLDLLHLPPLDHQGRRMRMPSLTADEYMEIEQRNEEPLDREAWDYAEAERSKNLFLPGSLVALCLTSGTAAVSLPSSGVKRRLRLLGTTPDRCEAVGVEAEQVVFDRSDFWKAVARLPEVMLTPEEEEVLEEFERPLNIKSEEEEVNSRYRACSIWKL